MYKLHPENKLLFFFVTGTTGYGSKEPDFLIFLIHFIQESDHFILFP